MRYDLRSHQPRIYAHAVVRFVHRFPMGNAAASLAAMKFQDPPTPHVDVGRVFRYLHFFGRIVGPECAVASADGAIAIRYLFRSAISLKTHCAAMARGLDHF